MRRFTPTTTILVILLSLLSITVFAQDAAPTPAPTPIAMNPTDPKCIEYSQVANLSTIGANSTYRSAFLQASKQGTRSNQLLLNAAVSKGLTLINDADVNTLCGNLTAIALAQAESNFTQGIVAQFSGLTGNPQSIVAGPIVPVVVILILLVQFLVFFFAP